MVQEFEPAGLVMLCDLVAGGAPIAGSANSDPAMIKAANDLITKSSFPSFGDRLVPRNYLRRAHPFSSDLPQVESGRLRPMNSAGRTPSSANDTVHQTG